jgi:hypothetical protein
VRRIREEVIMSRTGTIAGAAALLLGALGAAAGAAGEDVEKIVTRANQVAYYQGKDGRAKVSMEIKGAGGGTKKRELTILRWDAPGPKKEGEGIEEHCGDQKLYVYFERPADIKKMVFMVWKHVDRDDDRWLYLPAMDNVSRIAAGDKRTSFVGSDFFYEDVSGRSLTEDTHELVETTDTHFVIKNTPREPRSVEFAHYTMRINRATYVTEKVEYFNDKGVKYREYQALGVEVIQGFPTVVKAAMRDLERKTETVIRYGKVTYDIGIPESVFTERYLRRAPRKFLR